MIRYFTVIFTPRLCINEKISNFTLVKKVTGIILAGGYSSRMGKDKGLIKYQGKHLINYSVKVFRQFCDEIIISSNSKNYDFLPYKIVKDKVPTQGPLAGIYSCMLESSNDINLILPCDTPNVKKELFDYILQNVQNYETVVPYETEGKLEPLCAYYNKSLLPVFKKFIDDKNYRIPDIYKIVKFKALEINKQLSFYSETLFKNINYPEDL
ncbi:MAG: molybdenum cofactor guanylyltransferase [Marinilabiliales bacterium]|nr:MAG: molybdenum cofactor guanylyltransferase [Marinilabiliales bacterium]